MVGCFNGLLTALAAALTLLLMSGLAVAQTPPDGLHIGPVLIVDPGMHTAPIRRADMDAAGRFVVTGSHDRSVRVWSAEDGKLLRTIRVPRGPGEVGKIEAVAISPNGDLIAAGGWTAPGPPNPIYLFDRESGTMTGRIDGLPDVVFHLAFSPDGNSLAAGVGGTHGVRVYDRETGWAEVWQDADYGSDSYGLAFAPDGRLATTSWDGKLRLYGTDGRRLAQRDTGREQPYGVAFNPADGRLAVGFNETTDVLLFDGTTLEPLPAPDTIGIDNGNLLTIAWSADGATLFAAGLYEVPGIIFPVIAWSDGGEGVRRSLEAGSNTVLSLRPLPDGDLIVAAADPWLGRLGPDGAMRWTQVPKQMDPRVQRHNLAVAKDGMIVDFGYEAWGKRRVRFDLASLSLTADPPDDGVTSPPVQKGLDIVNWVNNPVPLLNGTPIPIDRYERSRSLAIHPDEKRFVLGSEWTLRAFDTEGDELWRRAAPSIVWAVNITSDGRLVVAAYSDGTIRWHRMEDGAELLALFPMVDGQNFVVWTPEGVYAASAGAHGVLRWNLNHGWDKAGEAVPAHEIPETFRPQVIRHVLNEMGTGGAIAVVELAKIRGAIKRRLKTDIAPGKQLHVLAMGVSDYGEKAAQLRLDFADDDARDVAAALAATQVGLYSQVQLQRLIDDQVTWAGMLRGFDSLRKAMDRNPGDDLAVVHFSGHGAVIEGEFYLLPYGVDPTDPVSMKASSVPAAAFRSEIGKLAKHGRVLVLLDACRSGATLDGRDLNANGDTLRAALRGANITVLTSSSGTEVSREKDDWNNGAFTEAFLSALETAADGNGNGVIAGDELTGYLTERVAMLTGGKQSPGIDLRFKSTLFAVGLRTASGDWKAKE